MVEGEDNHKNLMNTPDITINLIKVTEELLKALDARSQDIIKRRYGIDAPAEETLESIGREYGITRERVRQIQTQAKKALLELKDPLQPVSVLLETVFAEHGGIMEERHVTEAVSERVQMDIPHSVVIFYLDLLSPYELETREEQFGPHWRHPVLASAKAPLVVETAVRVLSTVSHPLPEQVLIEKIYEALSEVPETLPHRHVAAHIKASRPIAQTPFGEWGLKGWPETNPRGVGDKAYAVLRRHGQPEHFTRIAELINEASFDSKRANPQTVHNELIKDDRFVLVGRGLYGLKEWGYLPGTVGDVIEELLKQAKAPLKRDEIIEQVMAQRQVKKNTIVLGLQNRQRFTRTEDNKYTTKKL